jgi:hypothetical protein
MKVAKLSSLSISRMKVATACGWGGHSGEVRGWRGEGSPPE